MLKLVSTTLSKNTARLVDAAIKEQVKHQVVPAVGRIVAAAVQEQIGRGIEEGMKEVSSPHGGRWRAELTDHRLDRPFPTNSKSSSTVPT